MASLLILEMQAIYLTLHMLEALRETETQNFVNFSNENSAELNFQLNNEQILQLLQAINTLKHAGATKDNNKEYKTLLQILKAQNLNNLKERIQQTKESAEKRIINENAINRARLEICAFRNLARNNPLPSEHLLSLESNEKVNSEHKLPNDIEKIIQSKLATRWRELSVMPQELSSDLKIQLEIEKMKIKLNDRQKSLQRDVCKELNWIHGMDECLDNFTFKKQRRKNVESLASGRSKKSPFEMGNTHKSTEEEIRKPKRNKKYLNSVLLHAKLFKEFHQSHANQIKKINRSLLNYHSSKARKELQIKERAEKERLKALKERDEVAYRKLLEQTKNERLTQLLRQTDEYLSQIGAKVQQAKEQKVEAKGFVESDEEEGSNTNSDENQTTSNEDTNTTATPMEAPNAGDDEESGEVQATKTYYTIAHTIKEEITKQPDMLVGGQLKRYQLKGLQWLVSLYNNNLNGVLADEMGLGKTIQTISLLSYLVEKKNCSGPFLIIVPLSVLPNWALELQQWAPTLNTVLYRGPPKVRKKIYLQSLNNSNQFHCVLTTFDFVMRDKKFLSKILWNYLIIDEGHRMKNAHCKLTLTLAKHYKSKHRLLLTGTPLQNSIPELWSLLNFLLPTIFNSVENFENWFAAPFSNAGETAEMTEEESLLIIHRLHKVLRPFLLRRLKTEVEDQLPKKVERTIHCTFSAMQQRLYNAMKNKTNTDYLKNLSAASVTSPTTQVGLEDKSSKPTQSFQMKGLMNTLMQLRKVCNHPYLFNSNFQYDIDENLVRASGKFAVLDRVLPKLKAAGHRVLIFSQMTALMTILGDMLSYRGYEFLRLDGSTKSDERGSLVEEFNKKDSKYFIFMLSTRAGGLGLNLQSADTVIIFDSDWNPQIDLQAQARAHRIGQTKEVRVFRFVTVNSVEEDILSRANHKLDVDRKIIQAGMFNNSSNSTQRREYLMSLLQRSESENEKKVATDEELNEIIARNQNEYELFQEIDKKREEEETSMWMNKTGGSGHKPDRLMSANELPSWLQSENYQPPDELIYGRGRRTRPDVNYDDSVEEAGKARSKKKRSRSQFEEEGEEDLDLFGENEEEDEENEKEAEIEEEKEKEKEVVHIKTPTRSKKRKIVDETAQKERAEKYYKILEEIFNCCDGARPRSELFITLPSRRDYPDYYQIIRKPIDITTIRKRIDDGTYQSYKLFQQDLDLLFSNAKTYNIEGSQVHMDAAILQDLCNTWIEELFEQ